MRYYKIYSQFLIFLFLIVSLSSIVTADSSDRQEITLAPFMLHDTQPSESYLKVALTPQTYQSVSQDIDILNITIPLPDDEDIFAELKSFDIFTPDCKFFLGSTPATPPTVRLFRGSIMDEPGSIVFLAFTEDNQANGIVYRNTGEEYIISEVSGDKSSDFMTIFNPSVSATIPEIPVFCGVEDSGNMIEKLNIVPDKSADILPIRVRLAKMAIECDSFYVAMFDSDTDAQNYAAQLIGAVSTIYIRDVNVNLKISFLRLWPDGGEPFSANSLQSLYNYWTGLGDIDGYNVVHLLSGERGLEYGGVSYTSGACYYQNAVAISGFLNGSFPTPFDLPNLGNWDIKIVAHETGHCFGAEHTHNPYYFSPLIDNCGGGVYTQGTIMSYCQILNGYISNVDLRFHGRSREFIKNIMDSYTCWDYDCNDNGIPDSADISSGFSQDINFDFIPDECEDCNNNSELDHWEVLPDLDNNWIPDECQPDCNNNLYPDSFEVVTMGAPDSNYNYIPDECEPDCDNNGTIDYLDIKRNTYTDHDRNHVPDVCQDCNENSIIDWNDIDKQHNLFVVNNVDHFIREYHANTGVAMSSHFYNEFGTCYDIIFDKYGYLYIADFTNDRILKTDPVTDSLTVLISNDSHLQNPVAMVFAHNGNLLILAGFEDYAVAEYNPFTGAYIGEFVTGGFEWLNPISMSFGPDSNLYISTTANKILQYDGFNGSYIGEFVSSGAGGLSTPSAMTFDAENNLIVCSFDNDRLLRYDGTTGAFIDIFSDTVEIYNPRDVQLGRNGNIFVARMTTDSRIFEYHPDGRYYRSYVRSDNALEEPTAFAFRPVSIHDCNGNAVPDDCDISTGFSQDLNSNMIPDECETDSDTDGAYDFLDCDPNDPSAQDVLTYFYDGDDDGYGDPALSTVSCTPPENYVTISGDCDDSDPGIYGDSDIDGFGDACDVCPNDPDNDIDGDLVCGDIDNCPQTSNPLQEDSNSDGVGDACCCVGIRGNVNNDQDDTIDISDLLFLVDYSFVPGSPEPACLDEADVDGSGAVDVSDLLQLVDYMFQVPPGPQPADCN